MFVDLGSHFHLLGIWPPATLELERLKSQLNTEKQKLSASQASCLFFETKLDEERERRHELVEAGVRFADFANRNSSTGGVYCIRGGLLDQGIRGFAGSGRVYWTSWASLDETIKYAYKCNVKELIFVSYETICLIILASNA